MSKKLLFNFNREVIQNYTYVKYVGAIITATNTLEKPIKSAILKGSTKYRDIDTGEILEAFEEGRNLELVSVKMPVLTTTGKNLFDESKHTSLLESSMVDGKEAFKFETGHAITSKNTIVSNKTFEFKENTQYTIRVIHKASGNSDFMCIRFFYSDGSDSAGGVKRDTDWTEYFFSSSANKTITAITNDSGGSSGKIDYIMKGELGLFEGIATSYEPYKSNILSTSEDVELRGIGDVQDELDLLTGEMTKRYGVAIMDGSDDENYFDNYNEISFVIYGEVSNQIFSNMKKNSYNILCDKYYVAKDADDGWRIHNDSTATGIYWFNNNLWIRIPLENLGGSHTKQAFKTWLQSNPITVQYELATPIVKTVDLSILDQNENKVSSISSFNDTTHIMASSETIPPIFEGYLATKEG